MQAGIQITTGGLLLKIIALAYLVIVLAMTIVANAQTLSTIDTVQNLEISRAQDLGAENSKRIDSLSAAVSQLAASIDRGTGIVEGIGCTLTVLQVIQMILSRKKNV